MPRTNTRPCRHRARPRTNAVRLLPAALSLTALTWLTGCTEVNQMFARPEPAPEPQVVEQPAPPAPIPDPQEKPKPGKLYEWNGDGRRVSHIVVDTDDQKARFYDGDEQIGWTMVASGVSKHPTPTGEFAVMEKVQNKRSNLYGKIVNKSGKTMRSGAVMGKTPIPAGGRFLGASMPYFMRLTYDGIGLHAGPIPRPGRPASHGCIRMPRKMAPILYKHTDLGTRVSIVGNGPNYGNYVAKQRKLAAERAAVAAREAEQKPRQVASAAEPARRADPVSTTAKRSDEKTAPANATVASAAAPAYTTATPTSPAPAPAPAPGTTSAATTTQQPTSPAPATRAAAAPTASPAPDNASAPVPSPAAKPSPQPAATAAAAPAPSPMPAAPMPAAPMPMPMPIAPVPVIPAGAYTPAPMIPPPLPAAPKPAPAPAVATSSAPAAESTSTQTDQSADGTN